MSQLISLLGLPFLICIMMGAILGYCGIHVLKREVIFIDIALAQIAAVGAVVAHLAFHAEEGAPLSYVFSFGFVLLIALFYASVRGRVVQISVEAVIGISYAIAAAAALAPEGVIHYPGLNEAFFGGRSHCRAGHPVGRERHCGDSLVRKRLPGAAGPPLPARRPGRVSGPVAPPRRPSRRR